MHLLYYIRDVTGATCLYVLSYKFAQAYSSTALYEGGRVV
jgi:hypothetical protein